MSKKRTIEIDIDDFISSLKRAVAESNPLHADDLFNSVGLTYDGLDKIVSYPREILENLYADLKQPLKSAATVDTFPPALRKTRVSK